VLSETGYIDMLHAGAVVTGGSTLLDGITELGEELLGMPVRRALPMGVGGLADVVRSPSYATAVGLVKYGAAQLRGAHALVEQRQRPMRSSERRSWMRIGEWFREVF
jgi:cell division protein FtsA